MKIPKSLVKYFAQYDLKVSDATINSFYKRNKELKQENRGFLEIFYKVYRDRPLFIDEMENEIDELESKILKHRTNKKIYSRKGRRKGEIE